MRRTLRETASLLYEATGADWIAVRAPDDELHPWTLRLPETAQVPDALLDEMERSAGNGAELVRRHTPDGWTLAYPLAVAGMPLGVAVAHLVARKGAAELETTAQALRIWSEHLDTFLAAAALARRRHHIQRAIASALRHPILERGLHEAVEHLAGAVRFDTLLVAWQHDNERDEPSILLFEARKGKLTAIRKVEGREPADAWLQAWALGEASSVPAPEALRLGGRFEEVLVRGVRQRRILGRLLAGRQGEHFSLHDRELLETFTDVLAQRVVDLQREWTMLSSTFPPATVDTLLHDEDYAERWLRPVKRDVAMLYTDISGFTRICAETLRDPERIATLVDRWSERAVAILWEEGGAFDKMVGDCVIGLWGPPFFDTPPHVDCLRAARAAWRIQRWTERMLHDDPVLGALFPAGHPPLTLSASLNWSRVAVGRFGPNGNYTAFGEGMNNAARLQGIAAPGEILCMDSFVNQLGRPELFGPERSAPAKNVPAPLRFRPLLHSPED